MHATQHGKNRKPCSNQFLALFLCEYLWELKERKEITKIFKYSCLLQFIMKTTRKESTTVYFTFQTFPDTYQEIHLTKRTKISVSFFMFSNCSEVSGLVEISFLHWQLSMENTSLCGAPLLQLPHTRAFKATAFHITSFQTGKGKMSIKTVCPL